MTQSIPSEGSRDLPWESFTARLRAFVGKRVPAQDVEDVAQDVLLRVTQGVGAMRDSSRVEAWIHGIARRAVADYYRKRPAAEQSDQLEEFPSHDGEPSKGLGSFKGQHSTHEEVLSWLRPIAEGLPEIYREALILTDFEGQTQRAVATALGLSVSGIKSRVQRARGILADRLRRCCEIELGPDGKATDFQRRECDC